MFLKFFQTVRNEATFSDRFGRILNATVRGVIAQYSLASLLSDERINIMNEIEKQIKVNEESFGVKIVDIRIGRTDLTEQVSNNVYQRMRSEREKEANLLRAEGEELSKPRELVMNDFKEIKKITNIFCWWALDDIILYDEYESK